MNRLDELTLKLLDETIGDDELQELAELTELPDSRASLLKLMQLEAHLQEAGRASTQDRVLDQIQQERCERVEEGVMRRVVERATSAGALADDPRSSSYRRLGLLVLGITVTAACILFLVFAAQVDDGNHVIAQLDPHGSSVKILPANGASRPVQATGDRLKLHANETVETSQAIDTAEILYSDGTKLELLGETRVRLASSADGSKQITILSGLVQADVAPQPEGRPLRIVTQAATLEVLGTTLGVEVRDASTQLGVATGMVAMTRKADGQRVQVGAGRFAMATKSAEEPFQSHPFPNLPWEWSEDFERGLPDGWRTGELTEFPEATAVRAIRSSLSRDRRFVITSHNAWQEGNHALCRIGEGSVLHLRIRQTTFARITIMIAARSYPPATGRVGGNLFYTRRDWNEQLPANTWQTISVPLKDVGWQMRQGKKVVGPADLKGLAAYLVHVSTMDRDAGLVIDRLWITHESEGGEL